MQALNKLTSFLRYSVKPYHFIIFIPDNYPLRILISPYMHINNILRLLNLNFTGKCERQLRRQQVSIYDYLRCYLATPLH